MYIQLYPDQVKDGKGGREEGGKEGGCLVISNK